MSLINTENTPFETKQFFLEGCGEFTSIKLFANADVVYQQSSIQSASLQADASIINDYGVEIKNKTLFIAGKSADKMTNPPKIFITGPSFKELIVEGVGYFHCEKALLGDVSVHLKGSGHIHIDGTAKSAIVRLSGNGLINAKGLLCENIKNYIAGNGAIMGNANLSAVSIVDGSGEVQIYGSPDKELSKIDGRGMVATKTDDSYPAVFNPQSSSSLPALSQPTNAKPIVHESLNSLSDSGQALSVENMLKVMSAVSGSHGHDEFKRTTKSSVINTVVSFLLLACFPILTWIGNNGIGFSVDQESSVFRIFPLFLFASIISLFLIRMFYLSNVKGCFVLTSKDTLSLMLLGVLTFGLDTILSIEYDAVFKTINGLVSLVPAANTIGSYAPSIALAGGLLMVYFLISEHVLKPVLNVE
jgi:hypothetical protein